MPLTSKDLVNEALSQVKAVSAETVSIPEQKGAIQRFNSGPLYELSAAPWRTCSPRS